MATGVSNDAFHWDPAQNKFTEIPGRVEQRIFSKVSSLKLNFRGERSRYTTLPFRVNNGNGEHKEKFAAFFNSDGDLKVMSKPNWLPNWLGNFFVKETEKSRAIANIFNHYEYSKELKRAVKNSKAIQALTVNSSPCNSPHNYPCFLNFNDTGGVDGMKLERQRGNTYTRTVNFNRSGEAKTLRIQSEKEKYVWGLNSLSS